MQRTLKREIRIIGTGLHSGRPARLRICPRPANFGIWFKRVDITDRDNLIAARWDYVNDTRLSTGVANSVDVSVSTIEHLMAALAGCGVSNAMIEIDGPEIPIMDGSAIRFVNEIYKAGLVDQIGDGYYWEIQQTVRVTEGYSWAELSPFDGFALDITISFAGTVIGDQSAGLDMRNGSFARELADCRTFCRLKDVEDMQAHGRALGGSLDNALVVDGAEYMNPEGPRRDDECVRHKMLDAVGDLALAGAPILGLYRGARSGHRLTNLLLHKLFNTKGAAKLKRTDARVRAHLPGPEIQEIDLQQAG